MNDDNFEVLAPFTIDDAMKNNSEQPKTYSECLTASMRTVVSPSGVYVCPYHRGNLNMRIGDITKKVLKKCGLATSVKKLWKNLIQKNIVVFIVFEMDQINI